MSVTCLLCPSPAVADGLCVEDGAKLWAADLWLAKPDAARFAVRVSALPMEAGAPLPRTAALRMLTTKEAARAFLDKLEAARKAREAAP